MKQLLTITEVASYLRLSRQSIVRKIRSGELPAKVTSNKTRIHYRISREDLESFLQRGEYGR